MRLPREWTDADGVPARTDAEDAAEGVFSVDAVRALLELVEALSRRGDLDASVEVETKRGSEGVAPCPSKQVSSCGKSVSESSGEASRSGRGEP
jgi:hypothetical protein